MDFFVVFGSFPGFFGKFRKPVETPEDLCYNTDAGQVNRITRRPVFHMEEIDTIAKTTNQ